MTAQTIAGYVTISQQLLDRCDPSIESIITAMLNGTYVCPEPSPFGYIDWTDGTDDHWLDEYPWED